MKKPKALKMALIGSLMVMLCGCSAKSGSEAFSPIYIHPNDQLTDGTARQVLQHNELGATLFGWQHQ